MSDDFRGQKRPPRFYWLPEGSGTKYHAKICGAHLLEAYPGDEAKKQIRRDGLEPCQNCMNHHGLEPLEIGPDGDRVGDGR